MIEPHARGRPHNRAAPVGAGAWGEGEADRTTSATNSSTPPPACTCRDRSASCPTCRAWAAACWHIAAAARLLRRCAR